MGFFQRLFGLEKPPVAQSNPPVENVQHPQTGETVPPERVGPDGKYDQSGLAKRVAVAFEDDSQLTDLEHLYIAQTGGTVVLKGSVPSEELLTHAVEIATTELAERLL